MLGGLVSWVTTDLLRVTGALAQRGTAHQERDTTDGCSTAPAEAAAQTLHVWRPDGSMGTGIVNGRLGAAWGVWGRGSLWACGGVEDGFVANFTPVRFPVGSSSVTQTGRERESTEAQGPGRPCSAGPPSHGSAVGRGLSWELSPWRRAEGGTRSRRRPCPQPARGRALQSPAGRSWPPAQAAGEAARTRSPARPGTTLGLRQGPYGTNIVAQDPSAVPWVPRPRRGGKACAAAHAPRVGRARRPRITTPPRLGADKDAGLTAAEPFSALAALSPPRQGSWSLPPFLSKTCDITLPSAYSASRDACLSHVPIPSLILRDDLDRDLDSACRHPQRLPWRCVTCPALWAGFLVHNLHTDNYAAKLSHVPPQGSSHYFMTGHDSLCTTRYREPKLCEFGRGIRIRSGPPGMAKA
jgi:hypothetical protein